MVKEQDSDSKDKGPGMDEEITPPDGGWGWFCVVGCSLMHTLLIGTERTFGLIYLELIDMFNESAALTAWVGSLTTALRMGLGPLASLLASRFTCRKVVMVGGVIFFLGVFLSGFAPNLYYLFFTWGVLVGVGGAMVYTPSFIIVGKYFDKRRAIANGISTAGGGVGQFTFPPLFTALFNFYGFAGSLWVMGALTFNLVNCGALYRPLKPKRKYKTHPENVIEPESVSNSSKKYEYVKVSDKPLDQVENNKISDSDYLVSSNKEALNEGANSSENLNESSPKTEASGSTTCDAGTSNNGKIVQDKGLEEHDMSSDPVDTQEVQTTKKERHLDYTLFCDPTFLLFAIFIGLGTQAYVPTTTFVPVLTVNELGFTKQQATNLMSVIGVADMCGRLGSGIIFDIKCVQRVRRYVYGLAPFLLCLFLASFTFATLFWHFVVICIFYGLSVGMFLSQIASLLADWLGKERLPSAIGLATFFRGTGVMLGPVIGGHLADITGTYKTSFYYSASAAFSSGLIYLTLICVYKLRKRTKGGIEPVRTEDEDV